MREIADVRGWSTEHVVDVESSDPERMVEAVLADIRAQVTPVEQEAQTDFLKAFGWVPSGFDFERDVTAGFARELSGLYSFAWRRILLARHLDTKSTMAVLRHELVHAFQDSRYGIRSKVRWQTDRSDYIAAIHALAEGEAICVARQLEDPSGRGCLDVAPDDLDGIAAHERLGFLPPVVSEALISPYIYGVRYVKRLLHEGGWPAVERAWQGKLRATRELIRDTDVRLDSEQLVSTSSPKSPGTCEARYVDVLGEIGLRSVLSDSTGPANVDTTLGYLVGERASAWQCPNWCASSWHFRFVGVTPAQLVAEWLRSSLGLSHRGTADSSSCASFLGGAATLAVKGRDIAITSVHPCHDVTPRPATDYCSKASDWAHQLADYAS